MQLWDHVTSTDYDQDERKMIDSSFSDVSSLNVILFVSCVVCEDKIFYGNTDS